MNSQELLDVIDIIKNEALYNERLKELRDAEKQLADSRFIAATVAKANELKADADSIKTQADKMLASAKEQFEKWKQAEEKKFDKWKEEVQDLRNAADAKMKEATDAAYKVRQEKVDLTQFQTKLGDRSKVLHDIEARIKQREDLLKSKIERIIEIMKETI